MTEPLLHYSSEPLPPDWPAHLVTREQVGSYKPSGLWVSVGESWKEWCDAEEFAGNCFGSVQEVHLREDARILHLSTAEELDAFTDKYGYIPEWHGSSVYLDKRHACYIDWTSVAEEYQGIIITPYIWSRRLDLMWYYGWDCASGCIWDPKAIAGITQKGEHGRSRDPSTAST